MPGPTIRERRKKLPDGLRWCGKCDLWKEKVRGGRCGPCTNAYARELYALNERFRESRRHRGAARRRNVDPVPFEAREAILEEFEGTCAYCPEPATTWDHVMPVTKGGLTEPYNMVPACGPCNSSKRTQNIWTWLEKTGRTAHPRLIERLSLYDAGLLPPSGPDPFED